MFELVQCPACRGHVPVVHGRVIKHGPAGAAPCSTSGSAWSTIGAAAPAQFSLERTIGTAIGTALGVLVAEAFGVRPKKRRRKRRRRLSKGRD
jgi:hypothetical protein